MQPYQNTPPIPLDRGFPHILDPGYMLCFATNYLLLLLGSYLVDFDGLTAYEQVLNQTQRV